MIHSSVDERKRFARITEIQIPSVLDIDAFTVEIVADIVESILFKQEDQTGMFFKDSHVDLINTLIPPVPQS